MHRGIETLSMVFVSDVYRCCRQDVDDVEMESIVSQGQGLSQVHREC